MENCKWRHSMQITNTNALLRYPADSQGITLDIQSLPFSRSVSLTGRSLLSLELPGKNPKMENTIWDELIDFLIQEKSKHGAKNGAMFGVLIKDGEIIISSNTLTICRVTLKVLDSVLVL